MCYAPARRQSMDLRGRFELGDDGAYFNSRAALKLTEDRDARQNDKDPSARAAGAGWRDNLDSNESGAEAGCRLLAADSEGLGRGRSPLLVAAAGRAGSAAGLYLRRVLLADRGLKEKVGHLSRDLTSIQPGSRELR